MSKVRTYESFKKFWQEVNKSKEADISTNAEAPKESELLENKE